MEESRNEPRVDSSPMFLAISIVRIIIHIMLPQKHPLHYYSYQNRSHNVPEFVTGPVDMDGISAEKLVTSKEKIQFGFRMSD